MLPPNKPLKPVGHVGVFVTFVAIADAQHEHPAGYMAKLGKVIFPIPYDPAVRQTSTTPISRRHAASTIPNSLLQSILV